MAALSALAAPRAGEGAIQTAASGSVGWRGQGFGAGGPRRSTNPPRPSSGRQPLVGPPCLRPRLSPPQGLEPVTQNTGAPANDLSHPVPSARAQQAACHPRETSRTHVGGPQGHIPPALSGTLVEPVTQAHSPVGPLHCPQACTPRGGGPRPSVQSRADAGRGGRDRRLAEGGWGRACHLQGS